MAFIGNTPISVAFLTDTFSGNGSTTAFTMTVAPANTSSILVAVTGVVQDPSTYSVSGTTLTFSGAPPSGTSNISVRYLGIPASGVTTTAYRTVTDTTATASQTSFTIPSYTVGYVDVFRNGVRLAAADFTATTGTTVVLANACTVGDTVTTVSFYVSSVLNAIPATAGSVGTSYIADNAITTAKIAAGAVVQADLATGVAGTGPTFAATRITSDQTGTGSTYVKVQFQSELFDTANCYDTTNYRFTPNVAGYYLFNATVLNNPTAGTQTQLVTKIYKNGTPVTAFANLVISGGIGGGTSLSITEIIYMNGTTDYAEVYQYSNATTPTYQQGSYFTGYLVRSA